MDLISRAGLGDASRIFDIMVRATEKGSIGYYPQDIIDYWHRGRTPVGMREIVSTERVFMLSSDGVIKGFVHLNDRGIIGLFVDPDEQGKGYGRSLLKFALNEVSERPTRVLATLNAVAFYEKAGFAKIKLEVVRRSERDIYVWIMELA